MYCCVGMGLVLMLRCFVIFCVELCCVVLRLRLWLCVCLCYVLSFEFVIVLLLVLYCFVTCLCCVVLRCGLLC